MGVFSLKQIEVLVFRWQMLYNFISFITIREKLKVISQARNEKSDYQKEKHVPRPEGPGMP